MSIEIKNDGKLCLGLALTFAPQGCPITNSEDVYKYNFTIKSLAVDSNGAVIRLTAGCLGQRSTEACQICNFYRRFVQTKLILRKPKASH